MIAFVNGGVQKYRLLDDEKMQALRSEFLKCHYRYDPVNHNVVGCDYYQVDRSTELPYGVAQTIADKFGLAVRNAYFLKYVPGSFTKPHSDDDTSLTAVTVLEECDLVGGESLVFEDFDIEAALNTPRPDGFEGNFRAKSDVKNWRGGCPRVIPTQVGDTLVYGKDLIHGVARVEAGHRLVFIVWMKSKEVGSKASY